MTGITAEALKTLPKAEVHVHLEGCFSPDTIVALAEQTGTPLPRPREELLRFEGLADFLEFLDFICSLPHTTDQLAQAARAFSQRMADAGTGYADVIVNPTHWQRHWKGDLSGFLDGLDAGFREAEQDGLPPVGLCVSLLRQQSSQAACELVAELDRLRHPRVVALSVDGNEAAAGRTGTKFAEAFAMAGKAGLHRTVHAGESSGPEGIRDAIELLGADRIDHGVRAVEDPALMELLAERQIPLGVCPSSNLTLGLYDRMEDHPIDRMRRAGLKVSVNTDDPELLGVDLPAEMFKCVSAFQWDAEVVRELAKNSVDASYASASVKDELLRAVAAW